MKNVFRHSLLPSLAAAAAVMVVFIGASALLDQSSIAWLPFAAPLAFGVALAHALIIGAPLFWVVSHSKPVLWWSACGLGALVGTLPAAVIGISRNGRQFFDLASFSGIWWLGCLGSVGGFVYWLCRTNASRRPESSKRD